MSKTTNKSTPVFGPNVLDARVRERFLAGGNLDPKVLEKHLAELPDVAGQADNVSLRQPALSATVEAVDDDEDDDS